MTRSNRRRPASGAVQMISVVYVGKADTYINFPSAENPAGISFERGEVTRIPASLLSAVEATGLFEIVGPRPRPVLTPQVAEAIPASDKE